MIIGLNGKMGSGKDLVARIIQYLICIKDLKIHPKIEFDIEADYSESEWQVKKFAYAVKQICSILTGIPIEDFEKEEVKNSYLGKEWDSDIIQVDTTKLKEDISHYSTKYLAKIGTVLCNVRKITIRELLQKVGTDAMRDIVHKNCWVNALMREYEPLDIIPLQDDYILSQEKEVHPKWLISDVRFPNEAKAIKDKDGIVIRINRPLYKYTYDCQTVGLKTVWLHHWVSMKDPANFMSFNSEVYSKEDSYKELMKVHNEEFPQHESETALDDYEFDYIIDNSGTVDELVTEVEKMLKHFKIL
jgi:hypothetical protein